MKLIQCCGTAFIILNRCKNQNSFKLQTECRPEKVIAMPYHTHTISGMKQANLQIIPMLLLLLVAPLLPSCSEQTRREPVPEYRLRGKAEESWRRIKEAYYRDAFTTCLAEKKVVVSCGGCTGVMLRGVIHIDKKGRFSGFEKAFGRYCGSTMPADVEGCFIQFFESIEFPPELRGLSIQMDLGRALKC